jgi:hypothetical protein
MQIKWVSTNSSFRHNPVLRIAVEPPRSPCRSCVNDRRHTGVAGHFDEGPRSNSPGTKWWGEKARHSIDVKASIVYSTVYGRRMRDASYPTAHRAT